MRAFVIAAIATGVNAGGSLSLQWKDCGDASTHANITGLKPDAIQLGTKTTITGTGNLDEDVTGATYDMELKSSLGIHLLSCKGDASTVKSCPLPLGSGTFTFDGMTFPVKKGSISVNIDLTLAAALPVVLQKTKLVLNAVSKTGDKLFCIEVDTAPATDLAPVAELATPPMLCRIAKIEKIEDNVVDAVCSKQQGSFKVECEAGLKKVWDAVVAKECPNAPAAELALSHMLCRIAKIERIEDTIVDAVCTKQSKVPAADCETLLKKMWTAMVTKECPSVHPDRLEQIAKIQNTAGVMWTAEAHERFASQAPGASKSLNGVKGDWGKEIEAAVARGEIYRFSSESFAEPPESFDSAAQWPHCGKIIDDIRDQSNCGCCWAFAGAEAASDRMCIATNASLMIPLSAQDVCFCSSDDGCGGGQISTPWDYIKSEGAVSGGLYQGSGVFGKGMCQDFSLPHCHHHGPQGSDPYPAEGKPGCESQTSPSCPKTCDANAVAPHTDFASDKYSFSGKTVTAGGFFGGGVKGIQNLIMAGGPVETAFTVYSDFENYAGGIYHHVSGGEAGGHAVKIVGWGVENAVKYWKVANSWNPYWGEKGYFRIKQGEGGIDSHVIGSSPDAKWAKKGADLFVV